VVTGAAGGIGLAISIKCAQMGMKVYLADIDEKDLATATAKVVEAAGGDASRVASRKVDVSDFDQVQALKDDVYAKFGECGALFSNAGVGGGTKPFSEYARWQRVLQINLWGVINTTQAFTQAMIDQGTPCIIVNTGSKQGITCPPGDTGYNVSKAGVKVLTEGLQHELRNKEGCQVSAYLLIPGWVNSEIGRRAQEFNEGRELQQDEVRFNEAKPAAGAWMPMQVVDYMLEKMAEGKFYIICPDNDVTSEVDIKRMKWSANDVPEGRPPLSRWHAAHKDAFEAHMNS